MKSGIELIADERKRQIEKEGWTPEHDDEHDDEQIAAAAAYYASPESVFVYREAESSFFSGNTGDRGDRQLRPEGYFEAWPWDDEWNKKEKHDRLRQLVIAGALIAAEIDRVQRLQSKSDGFTPDMVDYSDFCICGHGKEEHAFDIFPMEPPFCEAVSCECSHFEQVQSKSDKQGENK